MKDNKQLQPDTDYEIVCRCQRGDVEAFEEIVKKYQKKMFNVAYRMTGAYNEAAEVVQDVFVVAFKNLKGFKGKSKFSTWLYTIAINQSKNRIKQIKTRTYLEQYSLDDPVEGVDGQIKRETLSDSKSALLQLEKQEIEQRVQSCINTLSSELREIIVLRDIQGFAYGEISAMLEIAEGTVKSRLYRAREALKRCLKNALGAL